MPEQGSAPGYADIVDAAERLRPHAVRTPLLESPALNETAGGRLLIKPEMLQRTGSFKFRGAFNRVSRLDEAQRRRGVVAYSSGNHAQGVAAAAAIAGVRATIFMPSDAPAIKAANTRAHGAQVIAYDRAGENREALAEAHAEAHGAVLVRPYEDPLVIAGQGTAGLEIAEDLIARGIVPDAALAPCSGGGLIAGCALALKESFPDLPIYAVEPEGFDDTARSLAAGQRVGNPGGHTSRCDALLTPKPGALTFSINRRLLAGGLAVSDGAAFRALARLFGDLKLVAEPSGAVALAAALEGIFDCRDKTVVIVCSGGNIDPGLFANALNR
jgi:threonine dehydratase